MVCPPPMRAHHYLIPCVLAVVGCGGGGTTAPDATTMEPALSPAAPDGGQQLATNTFHLTAGQEVYMCYQFRSPSDAVAITHVSSLSAPGVHHLALFQAFGRDEDAAPHECATLIRETWQPIFVSGTGAKAIEELERQVSQVVHKQPVTKEVYPHQIAFNVLPQVDSFLPSGYTKEEMKMENEGRKIMHHPAFRASVTCVRVPVYRSHSVAVSAEFERPVSVAAARKVLANSPGLDLVDDPTLKKYPLALDVAVRRGDIRIGDTVMLEGVGGGFTWGATLLSY